MTYNETTGEVEPRSKEEWLAILLEDGAPYWGEEITERENTSIRKLFEPMAGRLAELEDQLQAVQHSLRLDDAEGRELDYIGSKHGVDRREAVKATGTVTFSRDNAATKDYLIPEDLQVNTGGTDEIRFRTTETVVLSQGDTSVTSDIEAVNAGNTANVAADSISELNRSVNGVESVTNKQAIEGGRDREEDDNYRERIKNVVGSIDSTSLSNIYTELLLYQFVDGVTPVGPNSDLNDGSVGGSEAEIVVNADAGHKDEIAQVIWDNSPMGVDFISGNFGDSVSGTATLPNGQTFSVPFSMPSSVRIYVDITVTTKSSISKEKIKNSIVEYIGGTKTNGEQIDGKLGVGDDVIEGNIDFAARKLDPVKDITELFNGTSSSPTTQQDISIADNKEAIIDHSDISVTFN